MAKQDDLKKKHEPVAGSVIKTDRQMTCARFSPCGRFLIAGGYDQTVRRWDVQLPEKIEVPEPDKEKAKSKKGKSEAAPAPKELKQVVGHNGWVTTLDYAVGGKLIYTADSWGQLRCWPYEPEEPKPKWIVKEAHDGWIRHLQVSPDGKRIATCGRDKIVRVWSASSGEKQLECKGHEHDTYSLIFSPDGKSLLSGDLQGVIRQWNLADGKQLRQFDAQVLYKLHRIQDVGGVRVMRFIDEGKTLLVAGAAPETGGFVKAAPLILLFDFKTGKIKKQIKVGPADQGFIYDLHQHPDGFVMFVTSGQPGKGMFAMMNLDEEKPFYQTTKMANCHAMPIHPDGKRFAVAATNSGSNGNGRRLDKQGNYIGNVSPIHLMAWPRPQTPPKV